MSSGAELIEALFDLSPDADYVSRCYLGHEEVLVDGLWWACPRCHPATVAANDRTRLDGSGEPAR